MTGGIFHMIWVGRRSPQDWIRRYRQGGISGLVKGPYRGRRPRLTEEPQKAPLSSIIADGLEKTGFDTGTFSDMLAAARRSHFSVGISSKRREINMLTKIDWTRPMRGLNHARSAKL
jgi:transposase